MQLDKIKQLKDLTLERESQNYVILHIKGYVPDETKWINRKTNISNKRIY